MLLEISTGTLGRYSLDLFIELKDNPGFNVLCCVFNLTSIHTIIHLSQSAEY